MERPARRNSSMKALQAIKENSLAGRAKSKKTVVDSENIPPSGGLKRQFSPSGCLPPNPKRKTFGDITNAFVSSEPFVVVKKNPFKPPVDKRESVKPPPAVTELPRRRSERLKTKNDSSGSSQDDSMEEEENCCPVTEDTPVTAVQNILKATTLSDDSLRCDESLHDEEEEEVKFEVTSGSKMPVWKDIDEAEAHDPLFSSEYAPDIFDYMKRREMLFTIDPYLVTQPFITSTMRTILVDWLVEVQENFELFHETLYMAVKIVDRYLSRKEVKKEYLQLVGATSMLVASKFEELSPPLVDDFIYLCDDAYTHTELLEMECDILCTMDYDINVPVAYRFLRRFARAAEADMPTHTLARYICESTLQEYEFVPDKPSLIAAGAMYLAIRMKKLGTWTPTLRHYSGYSLQDMVPIVHRLNDLISTPPPPNTSTVRSKYSHSIFFEVALIPPLENVDVDAAQAELELQDLSNTTSSKS